MAKPPYIPSSSNYVFYIGATGRYGNHYVGWDLLPSNPTQSDIDAANTKYAELALPNTKLFTLNNDGTITVSVRSDSYDLNGGLGAKETYDEWVSEYTKILGTPNHNFNDGHGFDYEHIEYNVSSGTKTTSPPDDPSKKLPAYLILHFMFSYNLR